MNCKICNRPTDSPSPEGLCHICHAKMRPIFDIYDKAARVAFGPIREYLDHPIPVDNWPTRKESP